MIGSSVGSNVQIYCLKLADAACFHENFWNWLAPEEQAEADCFRFAPDRDRYMVGQGFLRRVLGAWLNCAPQAVPVIRGSGGKPVLASPGEPGSLLPGFNLSRCNSHVAVAVVRNGEIGVDIEDRQKNINQMQIARGNFSASEIRWLENVPSAQLKNRFTCLWSCKEAFTKAVGMGLALPLNEFSVDVQEQGKPKLVFHDRRFGNSKDWSMTCREIQPGCYLAAAVRNPAAVFRWDMAGRELLNSCGFFDTVTGQVP